MTNLPAANASLSLCLSGREWREVVVEHKLLCALNKHLILLLHIHFGTKSNSSKSLSLASGKDCRTVSARKVIHLAPDRTNICGLSAIQTDSLIYNHTAHSLLLNSVEVTRNHHLLLISLLLRNCLKELLHQSLKCICTLVLCSTCLSNLIATLIAILVTSSLKGLIILLVAILSLLHLANSLCKLLKGKALFLNLVVSKLNCAKHNILAHLIHLTLHHHNVIVGSRYNKLQVCLCKICKGWVNTIIAINPGNSHLRYRSVEWNVTHCQCACSSKSCKRIGSINSICGDKIYINKNFCVKIIREERPQSAVYKTRNKNLVICSLSLSLHKATGETAGCSKLLLVIYLQRHKINILLGILGTSNSCKQHCLAHSNHHRAICLLGQFAGFNLNCSAILQLDGLFNYIHFVSPATCLPLWKSINNI